MAAHVQHLAQTKINSAITELTAAFLPNKQSPSANNLLDKLKDDISRTEFKAGLKTWFLSMH